MFGLEVWTPVDLVFGPPIVEVEQWTSTNEFVADVQERYTKLLTDWRVNNFESMQMVEKKCTIEKWSNNNSGLDSRYGITTQDGIKAAHRNGLRLFLIVDVLTGTNMKIQRSNNEAPQIVQVDKLKWCQGRTPTSSLIDPQSKEPEIPSQDFLIDEVRDSPSEIELMNAEDVSQDPQPKPNSPAEEAVELEGDHSDIERSSSPERQQRTPAHLPDYVCNTHRQLHISTVNL